MIKISNAACIHALVIRRWSYPKILQLNKSTSVINTLMSYILKILNCLHTASNPVEHFAILVPVVIEYAQKGFYVYWIALHIITLTLVFFLNLLIFN